MGSDIAIDDAVPPVGETSNSPVVYEVEVTEPDTISAGKPPARASSQDSRQRSIRSQDEASDADNESEKGKDKRKGGRKKRGSRRHGRKWRRNISLNSSNSDSESATSLRSDIEHIGSLSKSHSTALRKLEKLTDHLNGRIEQVEKLKDRIRRLERGKEKPEFLSAKSEASGIESDISSSLGHKVKTKEFLPKEHRRVFELKAQFFSQVDDHSFDDPSIYPFIRVLYSPPSTMDKRIHQQKIPDTILDNQILQIHIESPHMSHYFNNISAKDDKPMVQIGPIGGVVWPPPSRSLVAPPPAIKPDYSNRRDYRRRKIRNRRSYSPSTTAEDSDPADVILPDMLRFRRPFRWLIQHRDHFERRIRESETTSYSQDKSSSKSGREEPTRVIGVLHTANSRDYKDSDDNGSADSQVGKREKHSLQKAQDTRHESASTTALEESNDERALVSQLRFLVSFLDKHLEHYQAAYRGARAGKAKSLDFESIWTLFTPGDIIYTPFRRKLEPTPSTAAAPAPRPPTPPGVVEGAYEQPPQPLDFMGGRGPYKSAGRYAPQAYRVVSVAGGVAKYPSQPPGPRNRRLSSSFMPLIVVCYYVDFTGSSFQPVTTSFTFMPFDGSVDVTSLEAYPLIYSSPVDMHGDGMKVTGTTPMVELLEERGRRFLEVCEVSHKLYENLTVGPRIEEINSPVIVDFSLAYQNDPGLVPPFSLPTTDGFPNGLATQEIWLHSTTNHMPLPLDWYMHHQAILVANSRHELSNTLQSYPSLPSSSPVDRERLIEEMIRNGHILLLPGTVYAFALRNRRWVTLNLSNVQNIPKEEGWGDLILPSGHKNMVRAVVENHTAGSRSTAGIIKATAEVDIVRGKGKGCIILLHGEPGVGKTSTAECVAAFTKRPLFPITCGDIGYEPEDVERNLENNFNLAHKWGCVMLLDEADVFLAKRSRDDLKRNGLVSIFLRILEYYPGILFLTTNRVGTFDDAFRSRLHLTLYYPKLARTQTVKIWEMNLRRVRELNHKRQESGNLTIDIQHKKIMKFAKNNWETLSWNGRQIRNAFQTAVALAEFDVGGEKHSQPILSVKQFKTIAKASRQFDDYLFHTHGKNDEARNALKEMVRYDDYEYKRRDHMPLGRKDRRDPFSSSDSSSSPSSSDSSSSSSSSEGGVSASDGASSGSDDESSKKKRAKAKKHKGKDKEDKESKKRKGKK